MANRPVYIAIEKFPFIKVVNVDFQFYSGFSDKQKRLSINSLHAAFLNLLPERSVLEISTKSENPLGVKLSAFNLPVKIPDSDKFTVLESAYQGSKVFEGDKVFSDLMYQSPRNAKKDPRIKNSGKLIGFQFGENKFPLKPINLFYNWLYITALAAQTELAEEILNYDAFTDIEFNPQKSVSTQSMAAAVFVSLNRAGLIHSALETKENFLKIVYHGNF